MPAAALARKQHLTYCNDVRLCMLQTCLGWLRHWQDGCLTAIVTVAQSRRIACKGGVVALHMLVADFSIHADIHGMGPTDHLAQGGLHADSSLSDALVQEHQWHAAAAAHDNAAAAHDNAVATATAAHDITVGTAAHDNAVASAAYDNTVAAAAINYAVASAAHDNAVAAAAAGEDVAAAAANK